MPQPFTFLMDKTVTVQRDTPSTDASAGVTPSWSNLSGAVNIKGRMWPKRKNHQSNDFEGETGIAEFIWALESDYGVRQGDRINHGGTYYYIVGIPHDFTNEGVGFGPYVVETVIRSA